MIMNKILVIAVAAVVVAGGVGAAVFFMNQGKSDDFSFKDCHFDLSGAKSLVIAKDSAVNSTSSMVSKNYGGDVGAATLSFADAANGYDYSLYKTNEYGNYIKVLLYGNDTTDEEGNAIDIKMVPVSMEISEDGKYILMGFSKSGDLYYDEKDGSLSGAYVTYILITTSSGKIYQLNDEPKMVQLKGGEESKNPIYTYYGRQYDGATYSIAGSFDSKLILKTCELGDKRGFAVAYVENDKLVLKEVINNNVINKLDFRYKVYNDGILKICTMGGEVDTYLVFPDGGLKKISEGDLQVYNNNLCTSVTYYDADTKFFASSYTVVRSLNTATDGFVTETINLTQAQSFEIMKNNQCRSELYRETTDTEITVYAMETIGHVYKFKLKSDCSVEDLGRTALPFTMGKAYSGTDAPQNDTGITDYGDYLNGYGTYYLPTTYAIYNGHICSDGTHDSYPINWSSITGDIVVSGKYLYKLDSSSGGITMYDLTTGTSDVYGIPTLVKVNSMDIINGVVIVEGVTNTATILKCSINLATKECNMSYTNVLVEVRLTALN